MTNNEDFILPFGKYQGMTLLEVKQTDVTYLEWLYHNLDNKPINDQIRNHIEVLLSV